MRIALFVVVVAVHLLVIWLFMPLRRSGLREEELALLPISMLLEPLRPQPLAPPRGKPAQHAGSARATAAQPPAALAVGPPPSNTQPPVSTAAPAPDWRAQAELIAQSGAQQIVAAEDDAKRRANALTAPYKPMAGSRVRGHEFGWDLHPKYRFTTLGPGVFVFPFSDQCAMVVVVVPWFGCSIGQKPPANGDLFKYMHGPVKFGDWDWRVRDP